ncbi:MULTISPECIES: ABC transporter ATP-binding protein [unclassified Haematobacter]|uniref:ABC transporter ATP-binding protein n=1 Tax=unclassified Haematobacter TaxID=2640585 RepID=UPI0025C6A387|nr:MULTISPECIES: ABC transporter ATP-binding protein [unclassified Haematobacter]
MSFAVRHLTSGYPGRPVLHDLSLSETAGGGITALLGPNGAGKSTALRAIAGLLPARGEVRLDSVDLLALSPRDRARKVAFVPQMLPSGVGLTVLEASVAAIRAARPGLSRDRAAEAALTALDRLGAGGLALDRLDRLSGGQRQMAGLAPALAGDAPLLLLDEPTSMLDIAHQHRVMQLLAEIARDGRRIVVVLHDIPLAAAWAERVAVLESGRLAAEGATETVLTPDIFARVWGVEAELDRGALRIRRLIGEHDHA